MSTESQGPVVVGVDGTDESRLAVEYAVHRAQVLGCGIRLVHAVPEPPLLSPAAPFPVTESMEQVGHRILEEAKQQLHDLSDGKVDVEEVIRRHWRNEVLIDASEGARLTVLGHRDLSRRERFFTSSTCTNVAARAHTPVVCVPSSWKSTNRFDRVVVGIESQVHADDALAVAFDSAAQLGSQLSVMHAWVAPYDELMVGPANTDQWNERAKSMLEDLLPHWRDRYPDVDVSVDVHHQQPAAALVSASESADLLVVGRRGHRFPPGIHLGSITRTVIREARCPVEVAPPVAAKVPSAS